MSLGFPEASQSFLRGQDILYKQFNDIDVYVEDTGKEQMYFHLFKNLLPGIKLSKIFALGGKAHVVQEAQANCSNKRKVYLVDLDFDEVLGKKLFVPNLIYLERYSIENYLIGKNAIYEQIHEKDPSKSEAEIEACFNYELVLDNVSAFLSILAFTSIIIQRYQLGIPYYSPNINDYLYYQSHMRAYAPNVKRFMNQVETALKSRDGRFSLHAKIQNERKVLRGKRGVDFIPGKWIICLLKSILRNDGLILQKPESSFAYSLAKDINCNDLLFIKNQIDRIRS